MFCPVLGRYIPTWAWGMLYLGLGVALGLSAPLEQTLGERVRAVYLHGAWIWTALLGFALAALWGLGGWVRRDETWQRRSRAWGWVATAFWLTSLPITLWAMDVAWNGLFLAEPRWRLNLQFGLLAVLVQLALFLLPPAWSGPVHAVFLGSYLVLLSRTPLVMHPPAPVFRASDWRFPLHFLLTVATLTVAAWYWTRSLLPATPSAPSPSPTGGKTHGP